VARVAVLPSVCNINEPIIFGTPIVLNPTLAAPFVAGPLAAGIITWTAFHFNLITRPHVIVPWTLPAPLGAYLTTGGDWRAVVLMLINFALITALYWPFVRAYDRQLSAKES
jgi:PTS system cellobiose-specific IIC component